jgi:hypothetical protein
VKVANSHQAYHIIAVCVHSYNNAKPRESATETIQAHALHEKSEAQNIKSEIGKLFFIIILF